MDDYRKSFRERPKGVEMYDGKKLFGVNIDVYMFSRASSIDCPPIVTSAIGNIFSTGILEEGIFRISASSEELARLKQTYDSGKYVSHTDLSAHTSACLLKQYYRELPDPLLTHKLYVRWLRVLTLKDKPSKVSAIRQLVSDLPVVNRSIVSMMFKLMHTIMDPENLAVNKMTSANLAVTIAQTLIRPRTDDPTIGLMDAGKVIELVKWMIDNYKEVWEAKRTPPPPPAREHRAELPLGSQAVNELGTNTEPDRGALKRSMTTVVYTHQD